MNTKQSVRGLGLVEIMIAVVVLGVIAAVAAPSFTDMVNRRRVKAVAADISTDLAYLRSEAMTRPFQITLWMNQSPQGHGMSCYTIGYQNAGGDCRSCWQDSPCTEGGEAKETKTSRLPLSNSVSYVARSQGGPAVYEGVLSLSSPRAKPNPVNFAVDVCGNPNASPRAVLRVELNELGRPQTCSPNQSMSGYGACLTTDAPSCPSS
ncbi:Tfp pilus assembly protein FimT/FimU [Pelomonas sp. KK5]|uniref:pilus assembly FimT family protein n=1 Tax=Pelomonas sp. KK5 TaxID=1855730 RepID=UPI00117FACAC|nr:prepilin-type N-terminal cleavage/methylation domain-containing protein [Pelomonas sp. KK5]